MNQVVQKLLRGEIQTDSRLKVKYFITIQQCTKLQNSTQGGPVFVPT